MPASANSGRGALLAQLEGRIALNSLLERFRHLRLTVDRLEWQENDVFCILKKLPIAFEATWSAWLVQGNLPIRSFMMPGTRVLISRYPDFKKRRATHSRVAFFVPAAQILLLYSAPTSPLPAL